MTDQATPAPLTDDELDAIQQRTDAYGRTGPYGYVINDIEYRGNWVHDIHRLLDEVDRLRAELESVKDARASEADDYVRQLRALPGWCRACPPGCVSCLGPDCECYEHEEGEADAV